MPEFLCALSTYIEISAESEHPAVDPEEANPVMVPHLVWM